MKWYFWAYSDFRDAILIKLKGKSWWVLDTEAAWFINSIPTYTYFMTCSKKNIIIRNYAYLWKYVTKIVNSLTLSRWIQAGGAVLENARNESGGGEKEPGKPV